MAAGHYGAEDTTAGWRVRSPRRHVPLRPQRPVVRHDVSYPGVRWHLRFARTFATFPELVAQFPEMRSELLTWRTFLRPRSAAFDAAVLAAVVLACRPAGRWRFSPSRICAWCGKRGAQTVPAASPRAVAYDAAAAAYLVKGSVRFRMSGALTARSSRPSPSPATRPHIPPNPAVSVVVPTVDRTHLLDPVLATVSPPSRMSPSR